MGLRIAGIIVEKQTAKKPGRPKFNKMLERIENGEANGVLAWLPDRLSRNSIDSGRVIYMLDENIIADLKFPHFWFERIRRKANTCWQMSLIRRNSMSIIYR